MRRWSIAFAVVTALLAACTERNPNKCNATTPCNLTPDRPYCDIKGQWGPAYHCVAMPDGGGPDGGGSGDLSIDRGQQDFGTVVTGQVSTAATFTITNGGSVATGVPAVSLSGANAASFMVGTSTCTAALAPSATCTVAVTFSPGAAGAQTATLGVMASPGGSVSAALAGMGVAPGALRITPPTQDFGATVTGTTSATITLTVSNTGGTASGVLASALTGTDAGQFAVTSDGCMGQAVPAGGTCTVTLRFAPTTAGGKSASFSVTGTPGGTAIASLAGTGLAPGALTISPITRDFGPILAGVTSATTVFTVTNTGGAATGALTTALSGTGSDQFATSADMCTGMTLAASATCTVTVAFAPTSAGAKVATLAVTGAPGGTAAASLTGMGLAQAGLAISPPSQNYGDVVVSNNSTVTLMVSNTGGVATGMPAATITGTDLSLFTVTANTCTGPVAAGGSCSVTVRFMPTSAGAKTATLNVAATPGGMATAALTGNGLAAGALSANPTSRDFGSILQGTSSGVMSFSITNTGGSATGTLTTALTGTAMDQFMVTADTCGTHVLAAAASCSITVRFDPSSPGAKVASLTVSGNPGGAAAVSLTGAGLSPAAISVSPTASGFGNVVTGTSSTATQFTVTNNGGVASGTLGAVLAGADLSQFGIVSTTCNSTLGAGLTCTVDVRFSPTTVGAKTASLVVSGSPGGSAPATLTGTGVAPGALSISPLSKDFGAVLQNTAGGTQVFTVMNTGGVAASAVTASVTGTNANQYAITADTCAGASLAAAASCMVTVRFNPTAGGTQGATLSITSSTAGNVGATLTGVGQLPAHLTVSPAANVFGALVSGATSSDFAFTVQNTGDVATSALTVALAGTDMGQFGITAGGCSGTLAAHASCAVNVHFSPTSQGGKSASLNLSATTGGAASATLSGTGLAPGALSIDVASHFFGSIETGMSSAAFTFTITNTSGATTGSPTGPLSTSIPGTDFVATTDTCNTNPLSNAAGSNTCTVVVKFNAGTTGSRSATLSVSGNPGGNVSANLTGTSLTHANLTLSSSPSPAAFGNVVTGTTTAATIFTVGNNGGVTSPTPVVVLADTTNYHLTTTATPCSAGLAPGVTCSFGVTFQPSGTSSYPSMVTVSAPGINSVPAALTGTGIAGATLTVTPTSGSYGNAAVNTTSASQTFTFKNSGGSMTGTPSVLQGGADANQWTISTNNCTGALAPNATCTLVVTFTPTTTGSKVGTVVVSATPGGSATVDLTGTSVQCLMNSQCGGSTGFCSALHQCSPCTLDNQCDSSICGAGGSCVAASAIVYVNATSGMDVPSCGTLSPQCKSIGYALTNRVNPSRMNVFLSDTVYNEAVTLTSTNANGLVMVGINSPFTIIQSPVMNTPIVTVSPGVSAELRGLTITGARGTNAYGIKCEGLSTGVSLTLTKDHISNNAIDGVSGHNCGFSMVASQVDSNSGLGINLRSDLAEGGSNLLMQRSYVTQNLGGGIDLNDEGYYITTSIIAENGTSSSQVGGIRIVVSSPPFYTHLFNDTISRNTAASGKIPGLSCVPSTFVKGDILWNNGGTNPNDQISGGCPASYSDFNGAITGNGANNINADPMFVSLGDYHIGTTSPCRGAGDLNTPTPDIDGDPRASNVRGDIGADQIP